MLDYDLRSLATVLRIDQREDLLRALGPMALALPFLMLAIVPSWRRRLLDRGLVALVALEAVTLVVWNVVEFHAYGDVLTDASYATVILAFVMSAVVLYRVSPRLGWAIGLASIAWSMILWVAFVPGPMATQAVFDWKSGLAFAAGVLGLIVSSLPRLQAERRWLAVPPSSVPHSAS